MANSKWWKAVCVRVLACSATLAASSAQTFTTLTSFDNYNGAKPGNMSLVQGLERPHDPVQLQRSRRRQPSRAGSGH